LEAYYRQRVRWRIEYWKVDVGRAIDFSMLTRIASEEMPELVLEHAVSLGPLNDEATPWAEIAANSSGRYRHWDNGGILQRALELLSFSDVLRTYDVTNQLSVATTLDRVAAILAEAPDSSGMGLLNAENELYLAAALGCTFGVMRHPDWRDAPGKDYDPYLWRRRSDEVTRAVHWQRIAPAFGRHNTLEQSHELLTDAWLFREGETWATFYYDRLFEQTAPMTVSCLMWSLPGTRTVQYLWRPCRALRLTGASFIHWRMLYWKYLMRMIRWVSSDTMLLTLHMPEPLGGRAVWVQDLAGDSAVDVTAALEIDDLRLVIPGELIEREGTRAATTGDLSAPGLVLVLK
jgi:hypothetical protein